MGVGGGSSDTATTPGPHDVSHWREHFPSGSNIHGDHLSLAGLITLRWSPDTGGDEFPATLDVPAIQHLAPPRDADFPGAGESGEGRGDRGESQDVLGVGQLGKGDDEYGHSRNTPEPWSDETTSSVR